MSKPRRGTIVLVQNVERKRLERAEYLAVRLQVGNVGTSEEIAKVGIEVADSEELVLLFTPRELKRARARAQKHTNREEVAEVTGGLADWFD
tara:strand:+ start:1066 stop:1341 length:276 start_codon:yes stop_codon:yes gene_type:complete